MCVLWEVIQISKHDIDEFVVEIRMEFNESKPFDGQLSNRYSHAAVYRLQTSWFAPAIYINVQPKLGDSTCVCACVACEW